MLKLYFNVGDRFWSVKNICLRLEIVFNYIIIILNNKVKEQIIYNVNYNLIENYYSNEQYCYLSIKRFMHAHLFIYFDLMNVLRYKI